MACARRVSARFDHDLRKAFKPRGHSSHTRPPCGTRLTASFTKAKYHDSVLRTIYELGPIELPRTLVVFVFVSTDQLQNLQSMNLKPIKYGLSLS